MAVCQASALVQYMQCMHVYLRTFGQVVVRVLIASHLSVDEAMPRRDGFTNRLRCVLQCASHREFTIGRSVP